MTAEELLTNVVGPNVRAALHEPNSDRAVFNACAAIEALASHLFWMLKDAGQTSFDRDGDYKRDLSTRSEAFDIVHAIAEAQKHVRLTAKTSAGRPVTNAVLIRSHPHGLGYSRWGEFMLDVGEAISIVVDGEIRTVAPIADTAAKFLCAELELVQALVGS